MSLFCIPGENYKVAIELFTENGSGYVASLFGTPLFIILDPPLIYICRYVYRVPKCVGGITWSKHAHAQSQFWAVKTDL